MSFEGRKITTCLNQKNILLVHPDKNKQTQISTQLKQFPIKTIYLAETFLQGKHVLEQDQNIALIISDLKIPTTIEDLETFKNVKNLTQNFLKELNQIHGIDASNYVIAVQKINQVLIKLLNNYFIADGGHLLHELYQIPTILIVPSTSDRTIFFREHPAANPQLIVANHDQIADPDNLLNYCCQLLLGPKKITPTH